MCLTVFEPAGTSVSRAVNSSEVAFIRTSPHCSVSTSIFWSPESEEPTTLHTYEKNMSGFFGGFGPGGTWGAAFGQSARKDGGEDMMYGEDLLPGDPATTPVRFLVPM